MTRETDDDVAMKWELDAAYWQAEHADAQLTETIADVTDGTRARWTLRLEDIQNARIRRAVALKLAADDHRRAVWLRALDGR